MSIVYCCITLEENWSDIKCWLLHDLYWTIPVAQANGISTSKSISIEVVDKCKMSMLDMDLFTVGDLNALITAMKVSGKQTITMADIASNLGRLKYERTVRASSSSSKHVVLPSEDNESDFEYDDFKRVWERESEK